MSDTRHRAARRASRVVLARIAVVAVTYIVAARFCLQLSEPGSDLAQIWIPSGIALAAALRWGPSIAIGVFLGELATSMSFLGLGASLGIASGNAIEPVIALAVLQRWSVRPTFERVRDIFAVGGAAAIAACASSLVGVPALALGGAIPVDDIPRSFVLFWLSVVVGVLLVTPFVLAWSARALLPSSIPRALEAFALLAIAVATGSAALIVQPLGGILLIILAPLLLWACLRFRARGSTGVILLLSLLSSFAVFRHDVTLGPLGAAMSAQLLQIICAMLGVSALFLIALLAERDDAMQRAVSANDRLVLAQQVAGCGSWELELRRDAPHDLRWTQEFAHLLGLDRGVQPSLDLLLEHVHEGDRMRVRQAVRRAILEGRPFSMEHRVIAANGQERVVQHTASIALSAQRRPALIIAVALDITRQKALDQLRDALIATASHELRTPLTSIIGMAGTLVDRWDTLGDDQRREFAHIVEQQGLRLSTIIDDTLMQSRLDSRGVDVPNERVHLRSVLDECVELLGAAGEHIDVTCPPGLFASGSADHVQRIVTNLLTNASKYGAAPISVTAGPSDEPLLVDIHVVDHGPGIPESFQEVMYERFARGLGTTNQPGTGLGLSIVRGLVEAAGGTIHYTRREDEQATDFVVRLPAWPRPGERTPTGGRGGAATRQVHGGR